MAERYEKLFSSYDKYYSAGSPALIVAEAILKDTKEDKIKAQLKFQNITSKIIRAVNIKIKAYDSFGRELQGIEEYQYADLSVFQGEYWGHDKAITLPNALTRTIKVSILSVVFQDDTIWECGSNVWNKLSDPKTLYSLLLDDELVKQYKLEYGESAEYAYLEEEGIWHCSCGTINQASAEKCYHCRTSKDAILSCDLDVLRVNADARVAKEKAEAEEMARIKAEEEEKTRIAEQKRLEWQEAKRKKRNKILMIALPILVVIALTPNVIKPAIENAITYNKASKLLEEGSFDEAQIAFQELGDYKDSSDKALESVYQKALYQLNNEQFDEATDTFNTISEYKDAQDMALKSQSKKLESQYNKAEMLFGEKRFEEAIDIWDNLGDYSDSKERILRTKKAITENAQQEALLLIEKQEFEEAAEILIRTEEYIESSKIVNGCAELKNEVNYQLAMSLLAEGNYSRAIDKFEKIKGYKDSDELFASTSYDFACELSARHKYTSIKYFEKASGYKDADDKLLDAKFEYCVAYLENDLNPPDEKIGNDLNPYIILKELVEADYPGAQERYDELCRRRVRVTFYSTDTLLTPENEVESISKGKYLSVIGELVIGTYREKIPVVLYITYPNGEKEIYRHKWEEDGGGIHQYNSVDGISMICGMEWENGISSTGTLTVRVDDGKGNTVGFGSILITD